MSAISSIIFASKREGASTPKLFLWPWVLLVKWSMLINWGYNM